MKFLLRTWGVLTTIPNRLFSQWALMVAAIVGLVSSIALIMSIPLYADSIYYKTLQTNINAVEEESTQPRPPFAFLFHYYGGWHGPRQWEDIQDVNTYIADTVVGAIGLPEQLRVRYISSDTFQLFSSGETDYSEERNLSWVNLGFMDRFDEHIELVEGSLPAPSTANDETAIEMLLSETLALELGIQAGEQYLGYVAAVAPNGKEITIQFPLKVAGIWKPSDPTEMYWISNPSFYSNVLFVPEETFRDRISVFLPDEIFSAYWYLVLDGSDVHVEDAGPLLGRISNVEKQTNYLLPNIRLAISPFDALLEYRQASRLLTILLYAFSIPIIGLILAFISLVSRLSVERRRNEIAILRSRGATPLQILGFTALEGLLLGALALAISIPVTVQITRLIAQTRSFLDFGEAQNIRIGVSAGTLQIGLAAIALVLFAMIIPSLGAARHTIISYKQETGRVERAPFWQRAWLDVMLFIPAAYGTYLLQQQGRIALIDVESATGANDPFQNPLLFLVPALGIFALTLFSLRLIHPVMALVARLAGLTKNASLTLAARQLSRSPGSYHTPLVILILTVSLSSYTASLARTLDQHLFDQTYYQAGADIQFLDIGDSGQTSSSPYGSGAATAGNSPEEAVWVFIPVDEYRKIDGVQAVARLARYTASGSTKTGGMTSGIFIGIDRVDFPQTAFWREDFASESLGALMNALALEPAGVLVDQRILDEGGFRLGDTITVSVSVYGKSVGVDYKIVGVFDLFPTWYPEEGPLIVGNLDYLFQQMGGEFPYRVLLKTESGVNPLDLGEEGVQILDFPSSVMSWDTPLETIEAIQKQPERQGLLGFLFIGFVTAALLTVLAFLLHMVFSFQRRFIELGVLRAAGLSIRQMSGYLIWELTFLILIGGSVGTLLGYYASKVFIPFMQIGGQPQDLYPPFRVLIAWDSLYQIYGMFGILFVLTMIVSIILLQRMKIFQAIKLGETV